MNRPTTITMLLSAALCPPVLAQDINFDPPASYFVPDDGSGASPGYVRAGDIDGDGDIDLITDSNGPGSDPTTVFWNDGAGNFSMGPQLLAGWGFGDVDLGDMDSDGDLDVLRCSYFSNGVYFFRNNGDGTFEPGIFYSGGGGCVSVRFADIDGDKDLDFITVDKFGGQIRPYRNINGLGFTSVGLFSCGAQPYSMETQDMDLDGDIDVVVANEDDATLTICYNDGTGAFPSTSTIPVGERPTGLAIADLDANGQWDLVSADWGPLSPINNTVSIMLADEDGLPTPAFTIPVQGRPGSVAVEDIDSDGVLDIIVACEADSSFVVLRGVGDGSFEDYIAFPAGSGSPGSLALADFDGDADPDVATVSGNNLVVSANISGTPIEPPSYQIAWNTLYDNFFNEDIPTHIATDSAGNVIVGGSTYFSANENDFQIVKLDPDGNVLWTYTHNGVGDHYEVIDTMKLDADDNIVFTGQSYGLNFSIQWATIKLDPNGNELWVRRYDGGNPQASQYPRGMNISSSGEVVVCGWARDLSFETVHFSVVAYDAAGNELFDAQIPGVTGVDGQAEDIVFAPDGSIYATGNVNDDDEFGEEMYTVKLGPTGQLLWDARHDATDDQFFNETLGRVLHADSTGAYVLYRASGSPGKTALLKYDDNGGVLWDTALGAVGTPLRITPRTDGSLIASFTNGSGVTIAAIDASGALLWATPTGGSTNSSNYPGHLTITPDGWIALIDQMGTDIGVLVYNQDGGFETDARVDSGSASDSPVAITSTADGDLLVLGQVQPSILNRRDFAVFRLTPNQDEPACAPDLAEPEGQLDFSDIVAFLTAFSNADPAADFAEPLGQFDFSDVVEFLNLFAAGCP